LENIRIFHTGNISYYLT